ncbi:MAG: DNRLRE domain-containing protein [Candidatus Goldbacteria bacterium]|nr:DNRLRE domain-containing protein [Candidatus Goldiibacteriota bacterium]
MKKILFLLLSLFMIFYIFSSCSQKSSEISSPVQMQTTTFYSPTITPTTTITQTHTNTPTATITCTNTNTSTPIIVEIKCIGTSTPFICTNIYDTGIIENYNNNYGNTKVFSIGVDSASNRRRVLIKFDLSSIPQTAQIIDAKLFIYISTFGAVSNPFYVSAHKINSEWQETTETWNTHNGGDFSSSESGVVAIASTGSCIIFLDNALVQGWVNGTIPNNGILLKQSIENTSLDYIVIEMKESLEQYRPYLQVKYIN